jgi:hypothetical protein
MTNEAHQRVNLLRRQFIFELRHAVAAVLDLVNEIFIRMFERVALSKRRDF